MKNLKSLALFTLLFILGACSVSPETKFLDAVKGKRAGTFFLFTPATFAFSANGKTVTLTNDSDNKILNIFSFYKAENDVKASYKAGSDIFIFELSGNSGKAYPEADPSQVLNFTFK